MSQLSKLASSQQYAKITPYASVFDAVQKMSQFKVGSVLIMEGDKLLGIFTERDLMNKVVHQNKDYHDTPIVSVMSDQVTTVSEQESIRGCYQHMRTKKCRHLPIERNGKIVGIASIRDLMEWMIQDVETENTVLKQYIQS